MIGPRGARQRDQRALVAARRAEVARRPDDALAHANLAHAIVAVPRSMRLVGRAHAEARRSAAEAVRLAPDASWAHHTVGTVALAAGRARAAETAFREALALAPTSADLHNDLGVALLAQNQRREAIHAFGESSRLDPEDSRAYDNARRALTGAVSIGAIVVVQVVRLALAPATDDLGTPAIIALAAGVLAVIGGLSLRRRLHSRRAGLPRASRAVMRDLERSRRAEELRLTPRVKVLLMGWLVAGGLFAVALLTTSRT